MGRKIPPRKRRALYVAILLGSRRRRGRLEDGTHMIEIVPEQRNDPFPHYGFYNTWPRKISHNRERFVQIEFPDEGKWEHPEYHEVHVRYYARVSFKVWKAIEKKLGQVEFEQLLAKAHIA